MLRALNHESDEDGDSDVPLPPEVGPRAVCCSRNGVQALRPSFGDELAELQGTLAQMALMEWGRFLWDLARASRCAKQTRGAYGGSSKVWQCAA